MDSEDTLRQQLRRLDRRSYKSYGDLRGRVFGIGELSLYIDHVQGDPFAAPSRLRVRHPYGAAGLAPALTQSACASIAVRDWMARRLSARFARHRGKRGGPERYGSGRGGAPAEVRGSGGSGRVSIDAGGQEILDRSAVAIVGDALELRLEVGLPAAGRRILGDAAETLLADWIPRVASEGLELDDAGCSEALAFCACAENQEAIRSQLASRGLVAFVADESRLPRASGVDDAPLGDALPFHGPESLRVSFALPHAPRHIEGLGIPRGVTLIVGGGYHGKSTLLHAIERGVYAHIPGDGREGVVSDGAAVKIRAEDGRRVAGVDIEPFVRDLPLGRDTRCFFSDDASGSTSQAANVMEAVEAGARVLLMDEDTCATNFMTRDARMQALVAPEHEPITPLVDRVRSLYEDHGVSTVLVAGSSGDFFRVADTVIEMKSFTPVDRSDDARRLAALSEGQRSQEARTGFRSPTPRVPERGSLVPEGRRGRPARVSVRGRDHVRYGDTDLELRGCEQIVDPSQTRAIARGLQWIGDDGVPGGTLSEQLDALEAALDRLGLGALHRGPGGHHPGNLARPRRFELAAALNRLRTLRIRPDPQQP